MKDCVCSNCPDSCSAHERIKQNLITIVRRIAATPCEQQRQELKNLARMNNVSPLWLFRQYRQWQHTDDFNRFRAGHSALVWDKWPPQ